MVISQENKNTFNAMKAIAMIGVLLIHSDLRDGGIGTMGGG